MVLLFIANRNCFEIVILSYVNFVPFKMLDFAIFAVTFVLFLLGLVFYLYPGSSHQTTVPGCDPSDPKEGNLPDIYQAGGLHPFLQELHDVHGAITSFWIGPKLVVSVSEPKLFEQQIHVFDKPAELFLAYKPLGEKSILFSEGTEGRKKQQLLNKIYSQENCSKLLSSLLKYADELCLKWSSLPVGQHIPLYQYMTALCMKVGTNVNFGKYFDDTKNMLDFGRNFEIFWTELEARVSGTIPEPSSPQDKRFCQAIENLQKHISEAVEQSKKSETSSSCILFDSLLKDDLSQQLMIDNALTILVKHHSVASVLTWALYFLATHKNVQEKIHEEIQNTLGSNSLSVDSFEKLQYLKQVINETLRISMVESWTARCQDIDVEISGHIIKKKTPVIHALGVAMQSSDTWSQPTVFDPDRFNEANYESVPELAFQPFGFAGKRKCPGSYLACLEISVVLISLCQQFELHLVEGQVVSPSYKLVTRPEEEVWITVTKRK